MSWVRKLGWVIVIVAVVFAVALGFMPSAILVDTSRVERGTFEVTVREEGKTRVVERYVISAPVAAYTRRVELDVGDAVQEGEVLSYLEPLRSQALDPRTRAEAEARVAAAEASLSVAQQDVDAADADAEYARAEADRLQRLLDRGGVSENQVDQAVSAAARTAARRESARRAVEVAEFQLEAARAALRFSSADVSDNESVPLRSPVTGRVLAVLHESEGVVNAGQPIVEVGDPALLEVEVELLSSDAVKISAGTPVRFERWGGDRELEGVVRVVEPTGFTKISALGVEEQRVRVVADFTSPRETWERLGDQYRVEAVFIVWRGEAVLSVPTSALFRRGNGWAAFVVEEGTAVLRAVEVGRRSGLRSEVLSGLSEGDTVVVHPAGSLQDGSAVEVVS